MSEGQFEKSGVEFIENVGPPALAYLLSLACPAIPSSLWLVLIKAVIDGHITVGNLEAFMATLNIRTYHDPSDFPEAPPGVTNQSNIRTEGD